MVRNTQITHLSTWLITIDQDKSSTFEQRKGLLAEPIEVVLSYESNESQLLFLRNMPAKDFLTWVSNHFKIEWSKCALQFTKTGALKRIDKLIQNETPENILTLKSLGVEHFTKVTVFIKSEDEAEEEERQKHIQEV